MGHQDNIQGIRYKEVCVFRIGRICVYYSIYLYYILFLVIHVLSLQKLKDLLLYLILSVMHCISAELLCVCQPVGVCIGKCFLIRQLLMT